MIECWGFADTWDPHGFVTRSLTPYVLDWLRKGGVVDAIVVSEQRSYKSERTVAESHALSTPEVWLYA